MSSTSYIDCFNKINFSKIIDHPNILIAARFWDEERYLAAKTCYKFMRTIDDLIDNHKAKNKGISPDQRDWFKSQVNNWLSELKNNKSVSDPVQQGLIKTIKEFGIPYWTLENFAKAMLFDVDNDGFKSMQSFLKYSEGATVAPSSIFVHLCGIKKSDETFSMPAFDVQEAAEPCAIFSYLVHIIRDFQKDQFDNLNYFADDLLEEHGLSRAKLREIAEGAAIPQGFRSLIREYMKLAEKYRLQTIEVIDRITPLVEPKYQLSLHIIFNLYLMVYERIDPENGNFTTEELNPTADEIKARVYQTIVEFEQSH